MTNAFLLNEAIELEDFDQFKNGMLNLNAIERDSTDSFLKHESIWSLSVMQLLFSNFNQIEQEISKFIEQLTPFEHYIGDENTFDQLFPEDENCFLGIDFSKTKISPIKQIIDDITFKQFKNHALWNNIDFRNLWSKRNELFPNITLCGEVEGQLSRIGNSKHFSQIVDRLRVFDEVVSKWSEGKFSYKQVNEDYNLRISPESEQTMKKYGNERLFSLPEGGTEYFELHIKTGDLRFHFYPDNKNKETYVGYIGPHLSTVSN